jgi:hypothetical protein
MKYLKLFETEIKKSFTDWLKNPKAPTKILDKYTYVFAKPVRLQEELADTGDFSTYTLLKFIEEENGEDIFRQISDEVGVDYNDIKRDSDLLDDSFEKWLKEYGAGNHGWHEFLEDNFQYLNEIDNKSFKAIKSAFEEEIKSEDGISYEFDEYLKDINFEGEPLKVYDIKISNEMELKKISNQYFDTDYNIFFVVIVDRILIDKEISLFKDYLSEKIDNLSFSEERVYKRTRDGESLKFYSKIVFESDPSVGESKFIHWDIKLVYKPKI